MGVLTVTILDSKGDSFSRSWKSSANKLDAIRWTVQSEDVPYYVDIDKITDIKVEITEE